MTFNRFYVTTRAFTGTPDATLNGDGTVFFRLAAEALQERGGFGIAGSPTPGSRHRSVK